MANYNNIKATIYANIKTNNNQEITGSVLQSVLNQIVNALGIGYQFAGIATPSTNPGTPDQKVFYLANTGTYTHFGNLTISRELGILKYDSSWHVEEITLGTEKLTFKQDIIQDSRNILPVNGFIEGEWVQTNGIESVGYGIGRTPFIPINTGESLTIETDAFGGTFYQCNAALFDSSFNIIKDSLIDLSSSRTLTWVSGAKYAVFTIRSLDAYNNKTMLVSGKTAPSVYYAPINLIEKLLKENTYSRFNIEWIEDKIITQVGNESSSAGRFASKYIPVLPNDTIVFSNVETDNQYVSAVAFYDINRAYISSINNIGASGDVYTRQVPDGAYYARLTASDYAHKDKVLFIEPNFVFNSLKEEQTYNDRIDITNYAILAKFYSHYRYNDDGSLVHLDQSQPYYVTSLLPVDKTKPLYLLDIYTTSLLFFDSDKKLISRVDTYPGAANYPFTNYPGDAVYMAIEKTGDYTDDELFNVFSTSSKLDPSRWKGAGKTLKYKDVRPLITIKTSDSQIEIYNKMLDAVYTGDCDVVFEYGTYNFNSTLFDHINVKTGRVWGIGLPIGNNCRYYFNNSRLVADTNGVATAIVDECNLLDFTYVGGNFDLHDAILQLIGTGYIVHDEGSVSVESPYCHKYENIKFMDNAGQISTGNLSKCIGGGAGKSGSVEIINCVFIGNDKNPDISWHGLNPSDVSTTFRLSIANSYFKKGISLDDLRDNETGIALISACSLPQDVPVGKWEVYKISNTIR